MVLKILEYLDEVRRGTPNLNQLRLARLGANAPFIEAASDERSGQGAKTALKPKNSRLSVER